MAPLFFFMKGDNMKKKNVLLYIASVIVLTLEHWLLVKIGCTPLSKEWWGIMLLTGVYGCIYTIRSSMED